MYYFFKENSLKMLNFIGRRTVIDLPLRSHYSQLSSIRPPPIWHDQLFDENALTYLTGNYFPSPPLVPLVLTRDWWV